MVSSLENIELEYITDDSGATTAVKIQLEDWLKLKEDLLKLEKMSAVNTPLRKAYAEVAQMIKGEVPKEEARSFIEAL
ncbi:hypothetical protein [Phaeodactylibacter xiamenensis]|jgi:hypothetical protein|uniref:Uncharacterized protein n=1 Tax=Phaeodactylibacter xiamenensis TaxID=1524460 RepID=A0A098S9D3_9BACT|nr:hypothetical protein [Phaeodactylibacter xiamenensis]KGE89179.1 hypothetical protein IX84_05320 [Phaeodactylibacter xiamenensis]MCR9052774.1 hypothetical protein [bacterium]